MLFRLLGYRRRWLLLSLFRRKPVSTRSPIVIGGCHRSGTTLLRVLLGRHPEIASSAESTVFEKRISAPAEIGPLCGFDPSTVERWQRESRSQVEFIEKFEAAVLAASDKTIWAEKTPGNVLRFGFIRRHFPNAWLVQIVRDGRDVVCSFRQHRWPKPCGIPGSIDELTRSAEYWAHWVAAGRRFKGDPRYCEIRYEDLIRDPDRVLRELLQFIGLEWNNQLLTYQTSNDDSGQGRPWAAIDSAATGRWRRELESVERRVLCERIGDLLIDFGYERDLAWGGEIMPLHASWTASRPRIFRRWRRLERIWIEVVAVVRSINDPRMPWWARMSSLLFAAAYVANPIDLIPDEVPIFGRLDDLAFLPCAMAIAALLASPLLHEKRRAAKRHLANRERRATLAGWV